MKQYADNVAEYTVLTGGGEGGNAQGTKNRTTAIHEELYKIVLMMRVSRIKYVPTLPLSLPFGSPYENICLSVSASLCPCLSLPLSLYHPQTFARRKEKCRIAVFHISSILFS